MNYIYWYSKCVCTSTFRAFSTSRPSPRQALHPQRKNYTPTYTHTSNQTNTSKSDLGQITHTHNRKQNQHIHRITTRPTLPSFNKTWKMVDSTHTPPLSKIDLTKPHISIFDELEINLENEHKNGTHAHIHTHWKEEKLKSSRRKANWDLPDTHTDKLHNKVNPTEALPELHTSPLTHPATSTHTIASLDTHTSTHTHKLDENLGDLKHSIDMKMNTHSEVKTDEYFEVGSLDSIDNDLHTNKENEVHVTQISNSSISSSSTHTMSDPFDLNSTPTHSPEVTHISSSIPPSPTPTNLPTHTHTSNNTTHLQSELQPPKLTHTLSTHTLPIPAYTPSQLQPTKQITLTHTTTPTHPQDTHNNIITKLKENALAHRAHSVNPDTLTQLRSTLHYYPGIEKARRLNEMYTHTHTLDSLLETNLASVENINLLIKSYSLRGQLDKAIETFEQMEALGYIANTETFVSLIQGTIHTQDAHKARLFYLQMRNRLLEPNSRLYTTLIKAHIACNDLNSAHALLHKMEDEFYTQNIPIDCVVYTSIIDGLVKQNKLNRAWKLFHTVRTWKAIHIDEVLFTVMIKACAKNNEAEKALNLLDDMKLTHLHPTDITYTELIHACCKRKEFVGKAFEFYYTMVAEDMPINTHVVGYLLQACATTGDVRMCRKVINIINENNISLSGDMYNKIILIFANAMKLPKVSTHESIANLRYAWGVLQHMKSNNLDITTYTLNALMKVYINGGYYHYAVEMLEQFHLFNCEPNLSTYHNLLRMFYFDLKDVGRFFLLWQHLRQTHTHTPTPPMLHMALSAALSIKSQSTTISILKEMYTHKVFPTPKLTHELVRVGHKLTEIHHLVNLLINLQKEDVHTKNLKNQKWIQTYIDEYELTLMDKGKTLHTSTTPIEERRKELYDKQKKKGRLIYTHSGRVKKRGKFESFDKYKQSKSKGGEHYSKRVDRPKPNMFVQ